MSTGGRRSLRGIGNLAEKSFHGKSWFLNAHEVVHELAFFGQRKSPGWAGVDSIMIARHSAGVSTVGTNGRGIGG